MKFIYQVVAGGIALLLGATGANAGVSADEAAQLRSTLTPLGAERAGNKDGSIPAWTGAPTAGAGINSAGRRMDPFANEKPLFSITAANMASYAPKLSEGTKALFHKFPKTFRIDVYPTRRTAIAPQWVYDNTAKNAVAAKLVDVNGLKVPQGAYGGTPFPIPKSGDELIWNHLLSWRGTSVRVAGKGYQYSQAGDWLNLVDAANDYQYPYYIPGGAQKFNGEYETVRSQNKGPAIRAGEGITTRSNIDDDKTAGWVYLPGQRRVRKLPNPCCDTPTPFSAGVVSFDEISGVSGRTDRFDWKIVGKEEIYVPYNTNRMNTVAKDSELLGPGFLNPDYVRWELHRVWMVDATLRAGKRNVSPKNRYYLDEDTWNIVLGDRYDASGTLSRVTFQLLAVLGDFPGNIPLDYGVFDLTANTTFVVGFVGERNSPYVPVPLMADSNFTPDVMAAQGVR